jgi:hypothetical protein
METWLGNGAPRRRGATLASEPTVLRSVLAQAALLAGGWAAAVSGEQAGWMSGAMNAVTVLAATSLARPSLL